MLNKKFLLLGAVAVCAMTFGIQSSKAATDSLSIDAYIVTALALDCSVQDLSFGQIEPAAVGSSTITVDTAGARSVAGGAALVGSGGTEGTCSLTGDTTLAYDVTIPATTVTGPGPAMAVNNFQITDGATTSGSPYSANLVAGAATLSIGADLIVDDAATQTPGAYTGSVTVTAVYQ